MLMEGTGESRGANMLTEIERKVKKKIETKEVFGWMRVEIDLRLGLKGAG
jgi:hypothetical protein